MPKFSELRVRAVEGLFFGVGFSVGSLLFNMVLQAVLYGIFAVLGLGR